jgi:[acyl-carrier-protein] S-malonyltransferase
MHETVAALGASGMAAVIGLAPAAVEALVNECQQAGLALYAANFNSPRQTVISGTDTALAAASERFKQAGARRVLRLQVEGPFHSPLMAEAASRFAEALADVAFADPTVPFFSNVTGKAVATGEDAKQLAIKQITSPVRWTDEETALAGLYPARVLEVGPGRVLTGLWRDSGATPPCHPAGCLEDVAAL